MCWKLMVELVDGGVCVVLMLSTLRKLSAWS